jgi:tetratricopeptide (TPR) repeat protein
MNVHFERATLLLKQHRRQQAAADLRQALAEEPDYAPAHALLAICLSDDGEHAEATREAEAAIGLMPSAAFNHYALGYVLFNRNRFQEAEQAVEAAIQFDPSDADYFALLANILLQQKKWPEALDAADQGLARNAENVDCANLRATALIKLGRKREAEAGAEATLARNPEDAASHTTMGWTLLERNQPREALEHFREALRLNPDSEWARSGIVAALKARYRLYGLILRYFLWISKLSGRAQWGVILGGYFGIRFLRGVARANPAMGVWIWPIIIAYAVFVLLTWLADPLFNLLLRLNKFGRYALSREEVVSSNWIGGCLALAVVLACVGCVLDSGPLLSSALVAGFIVLPLSAVFNCSAGWPRRMMALYTALVALVGCVGAVGVGFDEELAKPSFGIFMLGVFAGSFVANGLMMARPKL